MNKKKIAALALSGTLLMGAAGFGAYSWFTSQATVSSNLTIQTGEFNLNKDEQPWQITTTGSTQATPIQGQDGTITGFNKVQPGDEISKVVTITNDVKEANGLKEKVTFEVNKDVKQEYSSQLSVNINEIKEQGGKEVEKAIPGNSIVLKPGQSVKMKINVNMAKDNTLQNQTLDLHHIIGNENLIVANGTQISPDGPVKKPNPNPIPSQEKPVDTSTHTHAE